MGIFLAFLRFFFYFLLNLYFLTLGISERKLSQLLYQPWISCYLSHLSDLRAINF
jgi:hypothetical protein